MKEVDYCCPLLVRLLLLMLPSDWVKAFCQAQLPVRLHLDGLAMAPRNLHNPVRPEVLRVGLVYNAYSHSGVAYCASQQLLHDAAASVHGY
jgi:hypothetical protein